MGQGLLSSLATLLALGLPANLTAQRLVAFVPTTEANTSGAFNLSGSNSLLGDESIVTALASMPAHLTLSRGGSILLCQASVVHLTAGHAAFNPRARDNFDPLLLSLESGGFEVRMLMAANDTLETPEMHIASAEGPNKSGPLDLALRITPNGDTCVENRDRKSPAVIITDVFGRSSYRLKPGQHVLFQHGLIQEAVVTDTTSCGCPPSVAPGMSLADAVIQAHPGSSPTFDESAARFPFPSSTPEPASNSLPSQAAGETHIQVAGTLIYDPNTHDNTTPVIAPPPLDPWTAPAEKPDPATPGRHKLAETAAKPAPVVAAAKPEEKPKPARSVGGFFRKLFGR